MKHSVIKLILLFASFASACSNAAQSEKAAPPTNETKNAANVKTDDKSNDALRKEIERIAAAANGRVGVKAVLFETGETVSLNKSERFPMQSVYKLPIAMAVLRLVESGKIKLEQTVRVEPQEFVRAGQYSPLRDKNPRGANVSVGELLRFAVSESDGTASDVLFNLAGGARAIQSYLDELKVGEMTILNTEKEIGADWETQYRNSVTPDGAIALLRAIYEKRGLSDSSNALVLKLLTETEIKPNRLKGLLPKDAVVAHKTGTGGERNGVWSATNDIGIITLPNGNHLAIAVFVADSKADETTREAVIARIAKAVWDEMQKTNE